MPFLLLDCLLYTGLLGHPLHFDLQTSEVP
jgi:hypothetical protein